MCTQLTVPGKESSCLLFPNDLDAAFGLGINLVLYFNKRVVTKLGLFHIAYVECLVGKGRIRHWWYLCYTRNRWTFPERLLAGESLVGLIVGTHMTVLCCAGGRNWRANHYPGWKDIFQIIEKTEFFFSHDPIAFELSAMGFPSAVRVLHFPAYKYCCCKHHCRFLIRPCLWAGI